MDDYSFSTEQQQCIFPVTENKNIRGSKVAAMAKNSKGNIADKKWCTTTTYIWK